MASYLRKTLSSTFGSSVEKGKKENKASAKEADEIPYGGDYDSEASEVESSRNCAEKEEVERSKIGIMRALVQQEDPSAKVSSFLLLITAPLIFSPFLHKSAPVFLFSIVHFSCLVQ